MYRHILIFLLALTVGNSLHLARAADRPNVLFIAIDDLNHWVGYLGRNPQTRTPNIDRFASSGVAFTKAYCTAPACNPSRASLMSGQRPSTTGCYLNEQNWRPGIKEDKLLNSQFVKAGYNVYGAGKIYHGAADRGGDWTDYFSGEDGTSNPGEGSENVGSLRFGRLSIDDADMPDYRVANYGIKKLQEKHDKPFFLAVGLVKPHLPFAVPKKWFDMFPLDSIELPPHRDNDLDDVPPAGAYRDNTIVVLFSDHGWSLGEKSHWRKFALWEEPTRTVFAWRVPGMTHPKETCARAVDFTCIYPTLCELTGQPLPSHLEGHSIVPLLKDPRAAWNFPAVTTQGLKNHAVRSDDWRYIRYANGDEELYDDEHDPLEYTNLAKKAKYADRKAELAKWLPKSNAPSLPTTRGPSVRGKARLKTEE